jgi:hypothetical protein
MARVINDFLGEEIIPRHYIGKQFSQGTKYEGELEMEASKGPCLERQIVRAKGKVFFSTTPKLTDDADSMCEEKIALLMSALFGFPEARLNPSQAQEVQVTSLRQAMLPKYTPSDLLRLPIVVLKESFASNLNNK